MSNKKAKLAIDSRTSTNKGDCPECKRAIKPVLYIPPSGKKKMVIGCECGIYEKNGKLIKSYTS